MGYFIRAILCNRLLANEIIEDNSYAKSIEIYNDLFLIPFIDELFDEINEFEQSQNVGKFILLTEKINDYLKQFSSKGKIAYIEADYFGGVGFQNAIVWDNQETVFYEENADWAINKALKFIGIVKDKDKFDEFDTVGLGKFRDTEAWYECN